jgi:hypothetical protein
MTSTSVATWGALSVLRPFVHVHFRLSRRESLFPLVDMRARKTSTSMHFREGSERADAAKNVGGPSVKELQMGFRFLEQIYIAFF